MNFESWVKTVPEVITKDTLWKLKVYQYSLFLSDICWEDIQIISKDRRLISLSDQLFRSIGSISSNIAEGYSKSSGKDRVRFYEYALGSAREGRDWYFKSRHKLNDKVINHRFSLLAQIIKLLLKMIPEEREIYIKEPLTEYGENFQISESVPFMNGDTTNK